MRASFPVSRAGGALHEPGSPGLSGALRPPIHQRTFAMMAAEIAATLGRAQRFGAWWRCRCPVHGSRGATLALRHGERGLIVVCHAGCSRRDIMAELRQRGLLGFGRADRPTPNPPAARDN